MQNDQYKYNADLQYGETHVMSYFYDDIKWKGKFYIFGQIS